MTPEPDNNAFGKRSEDIGSESQANLNQMIKENRRYTQEVRKVVEYDSPRNPFDYNFLGGSEEFEVAV